MIMKADKPQSAVSTLEYNYTRRAADGIVPIWDPGRADVSIQVQIQEKKLMFQLKAVRQEESSYLDAGQT